MTNKEASPLASPPDRFVCPLTLELMKIPVRDSTSKKSYERSAILKWILCGKETCPLTRQPLHLENMSIDHDLMLDIYEWKKENGLLSLDYRNEGEDDSCCSWDSDPTFERGDCDHTECKKEQGKQPSGPPSLPPVPNYLKSYL